MRPTECISVFLLMSIPASYEVLHNRTELDEQRLLQDLLEHYDKRARPVMSVANYTGGTGQTLITISMQLSKMDGINPKLQTFTASGWVMTWWYDDRLSWEPDEYGGIETIYLPPYEIWLPEFVLDNSGSDQVYEEDHYRWFLTSVEYTGEIWWEPGGDFISKCQIDVRYFPFDHQICEFIFANWIYPGTHVNMTFDSPETLLETYTENGEWNIKNTRVWRQDLIYEGYEDEPLPEVHYVFHLQRKPLYFVMNIILPSIMLSCLVLLVFTLPPDSGEKMSMGVTLLLSYSVFILMISENVPVTSDGVPIIVVYLITCMGITCLTVGLSVYILTLHHKGGLRRPPIRLCKIALFLARILRHNIRDIEDSSTASVPKNKVEAIGSDLSLVNAKKEPEKNGVYQGQVVVGNIETNRLVSSIHAMCEESKTRNTEQAEEEKIRREWREIAIVLDKFFFLLFFMLLLSVTPIMLILVPFVQADPIL